MCKQKLIGTLDNESRTIHALRNANPKEIKSSVQKVVEVGYSVEKRRNNNNPDNNPLRQRNKTTGKSIQS